jgi:hypothetical protein
MPELVWLDRIQNVRELLRAVWCWARCPQLGLLIKKLAVPGSIGYGWAD